MSYNSSKIKGLLSTKSDEIPGNAAFLDVILALDWIQKHISNFGGDPTRVTLFGQSAGATIISALLYSPTVPKNLFHRVIIQSGSTFMSYIYDRNPERNAREIGVLAGLEKNITLEELNKAFIEMDLLKLLESTEQHNVSEFISNFLV